MKMQRQSRKGARRAVKFSWRTAALCLLAFTTSCISPELGMRPIPGQRAAQLTLALAEPTPLIVSVAAMTADARGLVPAVSPVDVEPLPGFDPGPAATPALFRGSSIDNLRASLCLTAAIYYEAATEPDEGQRAVAQVVLNRVRHPAYPKTVCGVVYQGTGVSTPCQFSYACDGSMLRAPSLAGWSRARRVAQAALAGSVYAPVGFATHYHTLAVHPSWGDTLTKTAIVGAHIFYRMPGAASDPRSFYQRYWGHEPIPGPIPKPVLTPDPLIAGLLPVAMPGVSPLPTMPQPAWRPDPRDTLPNSNYIPGALPESSVRDEYRNSGTYISR
jgi:hypothetical protein